MTSASLPIVGITLGDPAGIGPEVVGRALLRAEVRAACRPLVIGDARVFADRRLVPHGPPVAATLDTRTIDFRSDAVALLDLRNLRPAEAIPGRLSAACGRASAEQVQRGAELALAGDIGALATAPVNKEAWRLAGVPFAFISAACSESVFGRAAGPDRPRSGAGRAVGEGLGEGVGADACASRRRKTIMTGLFGERLSRPFRRTRLRIREWRPDPTGGTLPRWTRRRGAGPGGG